MRTLKLIRLESGEVSIGVFLLDDVILGFGLENPAYQISAGEYTLIKYDSPKFGRKVWMIKELHSTGDQHIEIHNGNTIDDTTGCIIIGGRVGEFATRRGVMDSIKTLNLLMSLTSKEKELKFIIT